MGKLIGKVYKLLVLIVAVGITLGLFSVSKECHKVYKEMKGIKIEMLKANSNAKGCTKRVADEIEAVRKEGTKVRVWFW